MLKKRRKWYEDNKMTGHSVIGSWAKPNPIETRTYGKGERVKPEVIEHAPLNELRARLVGYN